MKKNYSKPEIMFESFVLSTNIAAGCEIRIATEKSGNCGYPVEGAPGLTMFTSGMDQACSLAVDDNGSKGFCYHVPVESNNLFNS